ncbi:hypothetical protein [Schinkia azotoformans]|uniref:hypothetical protein n=1 Tax=Schinkia azotoformans TaxID=1454 RepID=UPI002DB876C3|nr:hypothetical protein [Schinkia azotoformans]MEC1718408.1 hypothetical protein [Schinkia azotoformans]MEC1756233.1 hypothetical protein [Schinkia azotoformans]
MKPNINLEHPIVKESITYYQNKMIQALNVPQRVESAVIPIYHVPTLKRKPVQIGSGVLVKIKSEYFILSASHVFDEIGNQQLLTGDGTGSVVQLISGERFSSGKGKSGTHKDDPIDASVFHIQAQISEALKKVALTLNHFDFSGHKECEPPFIASGFRVKKSNTAGNTVQSKREGFPSMEISEEDYKRMKIDFETHIALGYENQVLLNGIWQTSPTPKGFSGGAIIRIDGLSLIPNTCDNPEPKQLLTGIIIEQRRGKNKEMGVLIGTRIDIHLALIKHFLSDLVDDINHHHG